MNDSLASTLVVCDLDNLLLGEDGNLTQVVRDVLQLFSSRGGRLTVFSQRSPRAVRSILGSVRLAAPALVCGGTMAYHYADGMNEACRLSRTSIWITNIRAAPSSARNPVPDWNGTAARNRKTGGLSPPNSSSFPCSSWTKTPATLHRPRALTGAAKVQRCRFSCAAPHGLPTRSISASKAAEPGFPTLTWTLEVS